MQLHAVWSGLLLFIRSRSSKQLRHFDFSSWFTVYGQNVKFPRDFVVIFCVLRERGNDATAWWGLVCLWTLSSLLHSIFCPGNRGQKNKRPSIKLKLIWAVYCHHTCPSSLERGDSVFSFERYRPLFAIVFAQKRAGEISEFTARTERDWGLVSEPFGVGISSRFFWSSCSIVITIGFQCRLQWMSWRWE